ncbi:transcriptional repressor [Pseudoglutamicibacter albus]|uniref:Transcriptional repressor n=1 Tax=Pseudoglutamicibacter cumminsii TaxID=156979 RepID=A0ABX5L8U8_9MICC|nr:MULTISPECIES: transcriptional repressor [Pseudoglutamicibacter]MCT1685452.1 transcriptional repressor [Pseudoglutamicibacter cumminsii]PKY81141.1 transcriptional repressor [Pseudoglutamicibacter albus]PWI28125.1 transcriptional repressor [Pseudoglutamicibacter cumminsii]WIK84209.1 transcriptional repressor [Pseudoglutamicibacter albus]
MSNKPATPVRRNTRQRALLEEELDRHDDFRTAQEIHQCMLSHGDTVSLATIYRSLTQMHEDGLVDQVRTESGEMAFRRCTDEGHHHHLVCRQCGAAEEIDAPEFEEWADQLAAAYGFTGIDHNLEINGYCPDCSRSR